MSFHLGLTGSIGMGKTSTARMFADLGCAVWDADAAVHRLYAKGGAAVPALRKLFPGIVINGAISRDALREVISRDKTVLPKLEQIVHPLVQQDRRIFASQADEDILVFDIPLLFETGADQEMDATACVYVSPDIQKDRVLARGTMTEADLNLILERQMPSAEKCARATYVIETDRFEHAREQVLNVYNDIMNRKPCPVNGAN